MSNKHQVKNINDHIKEQNAIQQAKVTTDTAKQPVDASKPIEAPKAPEAVDKAPEADPVSSKKSSKMDTIIATKRKSDEDWKFILAYKEKEGLKTDKDLAEVFKVTVSNIHQKRAKFKKDEDKVEAAKLSTNTLVEDAKKLLAGIDEELKAFDEGIEEAKARVANAKEDRAKIEAKTDKFKLIIEAFEEDVTEGVTVESTKK